MSLEDVDDFEIGLYDSGLWPASVMPEPKRDEWKPGSPSLASWGNRQNRQRYTQPGPNSVFTCSHGTPGFPALRSIALRSSIRSSMSSIRSWSRRISAARDFKVGFLMVATLLICFLAILYSIHADEISFQSEKHSQTAHSQSILMRLRAEFLHITGKVLLQCFESSSDVAPLFFCQCAELLPRFFFDLEPIALCCFANRE